MHSKQAILTELTALRVGIPVTVLGTIATIKNMNRIKAMHATIKGMEAASKPVIRHELKSGLTTGAIAGAGGGAAVGMMNKESALDPLTLGMLISSGSAAASAAASRYVSKRYLRKMVEKAQEINRKRRFANRAGLVAGGVAGATGTYAITS